MSSLFCKDLAASKSNAYAKLYTNKDWQHFDVTTKRNLESFGSLFRRTPPPTANSYNGFTFEFDWLKRSDQGCIADCNTAYRSISQDTACKIHIQTNNLVMLMLA